MRAEQFIAITEWQNKTFGQATVFSKINHLTEEIEELRTALTVADSEIDLSEEFDVEDLSVSEEFADCFILLFGAAAAHGYNYNDICEAIDAKMQVNYSRKWGSEKANGVVNHIIEDELNTSLKSLFSTLESEALKTSTCLSCEHRQRWECNSKVMQYCGVRKSNRTANRLLKIKCKNAACVLYKTRTDCQNIK